MKIKGGDTLQNKTRLYLSHIINSHAPQYIKQYICESRRSKEGWKLCNTVGFFRSDLEFEDTFPEMHKHLLFVLVDINGEYNPIINRYVNIYKGRDKFKKFTKEFRSKKKAFHWDYPYDDPFTGHLHCFVFDLIQFGIPVKSWSKTLDKFDEGLYSQMFTKDELSKLKGMDKSGNIWKTLIGDKNKEVLKKRIEQTFGTIVVDDDIKEMNELDFPYIKRNEILHWDKFNIKI